MEDLKANVGMGRVINESFLRLSSLRLAILKEDEMRLSSLHPFPLGSKRPSVQYFMHHIASDASVGHSREK